MAARLLGAGTARITGKFSGGGKVIEDTITITVQPPNIEIDPPGGDYSVGFRTRFTAKTKSWPILSPEWIGWSSSPPGIVDIDKDGNAVMLKAGKAEIAVTENEPSPVMARVRITVVP